VEYGAREIGGLTGWVRNVGYDTVEAVAEGERADVERLIQAMKEGPRSSRVDEARVEWEAPTGEFEQFGVKRSL
jgi:acylphosphatase